MYYENNDWIFKKPPSECHPVNKKLNEIKPPYDGERVNMAILKMPTNPIIHKTKLFKYRELSENINIPDNFSWREIGQDQIENSALRNGIDARDQQNCGGCWAFSIVTALGDRISLKYQIKSPYLSSAWLISKSPKILSNPPQPGCSGNNVYQAVQWLGNSKRGIPLESCWPFEIISDSSKYGGPQNTKTTKMIAPILPPTQLLNCCYNCCNNEKINDLSNVFMACMKDQENGIYNTNYFGITTDILENGSYPEKDVNELIRSIQYEIITKGPVCVSIFVYNDFITYWKNDAKDKKIYTRNPDENNKLDGGHAVVITGWGIDNGQKFWEIRNSWGNTGDHGYCRIAFSDLNTPSTWIGVDIPIYQDNTYNGGVVSFDPRDIPNLQELIDKKILEKSGYGNILEKNILLLKGDFGKGNIFLKNGLGKFDVNLTLIVFITIFITILLIIYI